MSTYYVGDTVLGVGIQRWVKLDSSYLVHKPGIAIVMQCKTLSQTQCVAESKHLFVTHVFMPVF